MFNETYKKIVLTPNNGEGTSIKYECVKMNINENKLEK